MINAPMVFTMVYSVLKTFLHPLTTSKMSVLGKDYRQAFDDAGLELFTGGVPDAVSWSAELAKLKAEHPREVLEQGYTDPASLAALKGLAS